MVAALKAGYRHIDCAAAYGNEAEVGAAIAESLAAGVCTRADLFITSKLWVTSCSEPALIREALEKTLANLKLDYLNLYLVHWPFFIKPGASFPPPVSDCLGYSAESYLATWRELEAAVDAGKLRHIGCSNMTVAKLTALCAPGRARIQPAVNQVESHPFLPQAPLLAFCAARGILLQAFSPLGSPARPARLITEGDPAPLAEPAVIAAAAKHGVSPAQVLIRWQVQRGVVVLPKSTTPERIAANLDVFRFALDEADLAALAKLAEGEGCKRTNKGSTFVQNLPGGWRDAWDGEYIN